jgi:hypothetical protein
MHLQLYLHLSVEWSWFSAGKRLKKEYIVTMGIMPPFTQNTEGFNFVCDRFVDIFSIR